MGTSAAFFDLDGTLCTGHIWEGFSRYCRTQGVNLGVYYPFLVFHICLWLLHKARLISERAVVYRWGKNMAILLKGLSRKQADDIFRWNFEHEITRTLREDVLEKLRWHQEQGHVVVLMSGAFQEILELVGQDLGVHYVVGTTLEFRRRHYTGAIDGPFCFGEDKAGLLKRLIDRVDEQIDLGLSYAYADRIFDIPMLELVGNPVAVYPDKQLRKHAEDNGWSIVEKAMVKVR